MEIQISGGPRPFAMEGLASGNRFAGNINPGALAGALLRLARRAVPVAGSKRKEQPAEPGRGREAAFLLAPPKLSCAWPAKTRTR